MQKGNILVVGNSGVGKSTLINAVLGEEAAQTGFGIEGTTKRLEIYESDMVPFRVIDTVGFEPSWIKEKMAINAVKKWSKKSTEEGNEEKQINVIWFCVEGTSGKLFPKTIENMSRATKYWPSVPILVVITKSYSVPEREKNIELVNNAFAQMKHHLKNFKKAIPVVAAPYVLRDDAVAAPEGISELIGITNELLPEGMQAAEKDIASFILNRKRAMAQSVVAVSTASGVVVGAVPIPFSDALLLSPIEIAEINALAWIYGLKNNDESKDFFSSIVEVGTASAAARGAISALKLIPGINLGTAVLNAVIAGSIVAAIGEGSIYAFEKVYLGEKTLQDVDWVKKIIESKLSDEFKQKMEKILKSTTNNTDKESIVKKILAALLSSEK